MKDLGWAPVLIMALGGFLVLVALCAIGAGVLNRWRKERRRNRRLYGHGNVYSLRNFK